MNMKLKLSERCRLTAVVTTVLTTATLLHGATFTETFDTPQPDTNVWKYHGSLTNVGGRWPAFFLPTDGGASSGYDFGSHGDIYSRFAMLGDVDVQVEFLLDPWPANNGTHFAIYMSDWGDTGVGWAAMQRYWSWGKQRDVANIPYSQLIERAASNTTGKFRLSRSGTLCSGYTWDGGTGTWVLVGASTIPYSGPLYIGFGGWTSKGEFCYQKVTMAIDTVTIQAAAIVYPPAILSHPQSQAVRLGQTVAFSVTASGNPGPSYQWRKNGTNLVSGGNISGIATTSLTIANAQANDAGNYTVVVTNAYGCVTSSVAVLTVLALPPAITGHPLSRANMVGTTATFNVAAAGTEPLSYRWQFYGTNLTEGGNITGVATTNLTIANVQTNDAGNYSVVVTNAYGSVTSSVAVLTILVPHPVADALDAAGLNWTTGGSASWFAQTTNTHDGIDAAQSGRITHSQESWMQTTLDGPGNLDFWWKVSSELDRDYLELYLNDTVLVRRISGETSWERWGLSLLGRPGDKFTVKWRYVKDASVDSGMDAGWLDGVQFFPYAPQITAQPTNCTVMVGGSAAFSVSATGAQPLTCQWRFNGTNLTDGGSISGATTTNLTVADVQMSHAGGYSVVVSNTYGSVTSSVAVLTVLSSPSNPPAGDMNCLWAKRVAGTINTDNELAMGLAVDSAANVCVTGWFDGANDFAGTNLTSYGGQDAFVAKFNSLGTLQWVRQAGGTSSGWDCARGVGVDAAGNVYVTGGFLGTASFSGTTLTSLHNQDCFLAKYNSAGTLQWVRQGSDSWHSAYGTAVAVDSSGSSLVAGYFEGQTVMFGSVTASNPGFSGDYYAAFIVEYNSTGVAQWAQGLGGADAYSTTVGMDAEGNCYVAGSFDGTLELGTTNLTSAGERDGFLAKYSGAGQLQWVRQVKGQGYDGCRLGVDTNGNCYVVGAFPDWVDFGGASLTNAGASAMYLAKYDTSGAFQWARKAEGTVPYAGYNEGGCAVDANGGCYVPFLLGGTMNFDGAEVTSRGGNDFGGDVGVAKYDASGNFQWVQTAGGLGDDIAIRAAVDSSGNCYLGGWFQSAASFGTNVLQAQGYWDVFLAKLGAPLPAKPSLAIGWSNSLPQLRITGVVGSKYAVDFTTSLVVSNSWVGLVTNTLTSNPLTFTDMTATGAGQRFYRARLVP